MIGIILYLLFSYLVSPLMDLDLNNIIKVQKLTDDQVRDHYNASETTDMKFVNDSIAIFSLGIFCVNFYFCPDFHVWCRPHLLVLA